MGIIQKLEGPGRGKNSKNNRIHFLLKCSWNILQDRSSLGKFNKVEITSSIISNHNAMRLDINYRKKSVKKYKHMEAKQYATK